MPLLDELRRARHAKLEFAFDKERRIRKSLASPDPYICGLGGLPCRSLTNRRFKTKQNKLSHHDGTLSILSPLNLSFAALAVPFQADVRRTLSMTSPCHCGS
jgi:hypothetical protein